MNGAQQISESEASHSAEPTGQIGATANGDSVGRSTSVRIVPVASRLRSRRGFVWGAIAAVVAVAAIGFYSPWSSRSGRNATAASPAATGKVANANIKEVKVDRPSATSIASVTLSATLRPWQSTNMFARVTGYLTKWHKDFGDTVKQGELLAEIETPELDQEVAEAEALASEALAAAVQSRAERTEAEADLQVAEAQLVRVQAEADLAKSQLARREKLLAIRVVSQEEFDTFSKQSEARLADVESAKADVARRRTSLVTRAAVIEAREATARSRQANVTRLKETQEFKRLVAPFDGVITQRTAEIGMLVSPGKESLFTVQDMSRVRAQIHVPQTYAAQTARGTKALISVPESHLNAVEAVVTRTAESVDAESRTMLVEVEIDNAARGYQPGSYAQVTLTTQSPGSSWTIPTNTIFTRVEGTSVAVVNERSEIEVRSVKLGRDLGARIVVVEGIRGDERLVVNPTDDLTTGARIRVSQPIGIAKN